MVADNLAEGLYDALITSSLEERLNRTLLEAERVALHKSDQPELLARHVGDVLRRVLPELDRDTQLRVINEILDDVGAQGDRLAAAQRLLSLTQRERPGAHNPYRVHPSTPLSEAALLTNSAGEPALGTEIRAELESADHVDLLCAFIKWHGLRTMETELSRLADRGVPFRVITTTYMGATERRALDRLAQEFGAEVRISYEIQRTRLHAKAWLFRRFTGFDTAYVGSSNLSRAALLDGVEWNVRLSSVTTGALLRKFRATFDTYWNDPAYELYDPETDGAGLDQALAEAGGTATRGRQTLTLSGLDVRPYPHQQEALEDLQAERDNHQHHRNLIVAATGTGKTVIAALDYRRLCAAEGRRLSLLFVAHRKEILEQALRTYREVLNDADFGDLYVAGQRPTQWRHLFASIQTLNARDITSIEPKAFEIVVIDEFHHAAAKSYQAILEHLEPVELLGLTATPERADGFDIRHYFDQRTAVELRLWDALSADLLCPFHYFGIGDGTDLRRLTWSRGAYDFTELNRLYTGNDARARLVLNEVADKIADPLRMRALGFCVSVEHAHYMAAVFNNAGIPSNVVTGETPAAERAEALASLRDLSVNVLFTVDLYNEGVDLPDIDTVLFLRPTESATIFLQQLGRGLRRTQDKAVLTVLDFVGHQRKEFRFDKRFSAITGLARGELKDAVEDRFPYLPSGCQIILDKTTQEAVLANLKAQLSSRWTDLVAEARTIRTTSLREFLERSGFERADVLRDRGRANPRSWTRVRREAGVPTPPVGPREEYLLRRVPNLAHVDDALRAQVYLDLLAPNAPSYSELSPLEQIIARMLFFSLWPDNGGFEDYDSGLAALQLEPAFCDEASQVIEISVATSRYIPRPLPALDLNPLRSHAHYSREEITAALDWASLTRSPQVMRQGVFHATERNTDALMVTLRKNEKNFSPTTMYRDFAISPELFHWESQSVTTQRSPTGQRYLGQRENGNHVLMFSRETDDSDVGTAEPFLLLGACELVSFEGEQPIAVTWRLNRRMPQDHFQAASVHAR
ncbi:DUF3427 domain-containing protein [Ammonicoccus fulvus]|uniref:DUF3427 domain-containing protein n=1 Tax=Ammonicoccus fulvus TaxID=3138240 RepID=A0ABZ3FJZ5_9ACTN